MAAMYASRRPDARFFHPVPLFSAGGGRRHADSNSEKERRREVRRALDPAGGWGEDFRNYGTALVPRDSSSVDGKAPGPCLHGHDNAILIMHVNWFPSPA